MKTFEKIEKLMSRFFSVHKNSVTTSRQMDERILDDALAAYENSQAQRLADRPNVWRIIIK